MAAQVIEPQPREGSIVAVDGENGPWKVRTVSVEPGKHYQVAWVERPDAVEKWERGGHTVPLSRCHVIPPDLEDWPCSPV